MSVGNIRNKRWWSRTRDQLRLLITNNLLGHSKLTYKDFTPLATLASDWEVVVVSKDSSVENANELMEQLKQNKKNFKIGVAPA